MADSDPIRGVIPKPPGTREFTLRAVIAGIVVAAIMGAVYPYIVLKLGFGPNVSVVAAFFGYLVARHHLPRLQPLGEQHRPDRRHLGGADRVHVRAPRGVRHALQQSTRRASRSRRRRSSRSCGSTAAGILGVLLAVPLRQHFVVDEKLTYADGVAAAETLIVLDSRGNEARAAARSRSASARPVGLPDAASQLRWGAAAHARTRWSPRRSSPRCSASRRATTGAGVSVSLLCHRLGHDRRHPHQHQHARSAPSSRGSSRRSSSSHDGIIEAPRQRRDDVLLLGDVARHRHARRRRAHRAARCKWRMLVATFTHLSRDVDRSRTSSR